MNSADELIDVLNADGRSTGVRKLRQEVHRDGDWHRSAHLWIVTRPGEILLQRRSLSKENNRGLWDVSVAGHINAGETPQLAIVREAEEELGLSISIEELEYAGSIVESSVLNDGRYIENEFHEIFIMRRDVDPKTLRLQPGEVEDVARVPVEQLRTRADLVPHAEEYAMILRLLSG